MAHILIVDDESDVRLATIMALQRGGHTASEADSGIKAMKLLRERHREEPFDVIVCDVMMPGMTGHEVCQLVRLDPEMKNLPFVFLSGKRESEERLEGLEVGADDYLGKPFALEELLIRVNGVMAKHKALPTGYIPSDPLTQISLAQCIDLIVRHSLSGKLTALLKGAIQGLIFFEGGHAVHAKLGEKVGEAAVREILSAHLLMYSFEAYEVADQITMAMDISRLIKRS
jgi:DNA-binding response OmpR family regulator